MRKLAVAFFLALLATPPAVVGQPVEKARRIGFLTDTGMALGADSDAHVFREALKGLGWAEGQSFLLEYRSGNRYEQLPDLAAELVRLPVDVILAVGTIPSLAAKRATLTIPIVTLSGDPVASGLVASLARPGGNVTGVAANPGPEIAAKDLQLLKEVIPNASRVGMLWDQSHPFFPPYWEAMQAAGASLGVTLKIFNLRSDEDLIPALAALARERPHALKVADSGPIYRNMRAIIDFAATKRLPAMYFDRAYTEAGGLMSYAPSWRDTVRRGAVYVERILKGAKPADLPVEHQTKFEFIINLKTAKALGLTIPQSILLRADEVIQ